MLRVHELLKLGIAADGRLIFVARQVGMDARMQLVGTGFVELGWAGAQEYRGRHSNNPSAAPIQAAAKSAWNDSPRRRYTVNVAAVV